MNQGPTSCPLTNTGELNAPFSNLLGVSHLSSWGMSWPLGLIHLRCLTSSMLGTWALHVSTRFFPALISCRPEGKMRRCGPEDLLFWEVTHPAMVSLVRCHYILTHVMYVHFAHVGLLKTAFAPGIENGFLFAGFQKLLENWDTFLKSPFKFRCGNLKTRHDIIGLTSILILYSVCLFVLGDMFVQVCRYISKKECISDESTMSFGGFSWWDITPFSRFISKNKVWRFTGPSVGLTASEEKL